MASRMPHTPPSPASLGAAGLLCQGDTSAIMSGHRTPSAVRAGAGGARGATRRADHSLPQLPASLCPRAPEPGPVWGVLRVLVPARPGTTPRRPAALQSDGRPVHELRATGPLAARRAVPGL